MSARPMASEILFDALLYGSASLRSWLLWSYRYARRLTNELNETFDFFFTDFRNARYYSGKALKKKERRN